MRRRALPQGSPCGVEESDLEIYLTRSYALARLFPLLDASEAQKSAVRAGHPWFRLGFFQAPINLHYEYSIANGNETCQGKREIFFPSLGRYLFYLH